MTEYPKNDTSETYTPLEFDSDFLNAIRTHQRRLQRNMEVFCPSGWTNHWINEVCMAPRTPPEPIASAPDIRITTPMYHLTRIPHAKGDTVDGYTVVDDSFHSHFGEWYITPIGSLLFAP